MLGGGARGRVSEVALKSGAGAAWSQRPGLSDVRREWTREPCAVVSGEVPHWLGEQYGTLFRQMGGAFHDDSREAFLDGLAHLSSFSFERGDVLFSNRYVRSEHFERFASEGVRSWAVTARVPEQQGLVARARGAFMRLFQKSAQYTNAFNPNVNVWSLGRGADGRPRLAAATEADGVVCEFDPKSLDTVGGVAALETARGASVITNAAHWLFDPVLPLAAGGDAGCGFHAGLEMHMSWGLQGPVFRFSTVVWAGHAPPLKRAMELPVAEFSWSARAKQPLARRAAYMHTVAQTSRHLVLLVSSRRLAYERLLERKMDGGFFGLFDETDAPCEFIVLDISPSGALTLRGSYQCAPGESYMMWHLSNSFCSPDGKRITIDVSCSPNTQLKAGVHDTQRNELRRFEIDLEHAGPATVSSRSLTRCAALPPHMDGHEFPNINPRYHLRGDYRFAYMLRNHFQTDGTASIDRVDVSTGDLRPLQGLRRGEVLTEPVFVPRATVSTMTTSPKTTGGGGGGDDREGSNASGEDELDGVVLTEAIDTAAGTSDLLVVEPKTMAVIARIRAPMCGNVGLHSTYVPASLDKLVSKF
jgi:carotenoid cleavage dioxygenase-like enzyme